MKNTDGQLYTIEGFAAALIMIATAYLVVNATSVYTAGDTHISDMQLEALGTDALKVMDIPVSKNLSKEEPSLMQEIINSDNGPAFGSNFSYLINNKTGQKSDHIQYNASYSYRNTMDNSVNSNFINASRNLYGGEHAVRVTKWVVVKKDLDGNGLKDRAVLVEVLMWRD